MPASTVLPGKGTRMKPAAIAGIVIASLILLGLSVSAGAPNNSARQETLGSVATAVPTASPVAPLAPVEVAVAAEPAEPAATVTPVPPQVIYIQVPPQI